MNKSNAYALRLPQSLKNEVVRIANADRTSVNQFIAIAVAEKIAALETESYFEKRAKNADMDAFYKILTRKGGQKPESGDEIL